MISYFFLTKSSELFFIFILFEMLMRALAAQYSDVEYMYILNRDMLYGDQQWLTESITLLLRAKSVASNCSLFEIS